MDLLLAVCAVEADRLVEWLRQGGVVNWDKRVRGAARVCVIALPQPARGCRLPGGMAAAVGGDRR
jgi:hypothetical protein